MQNTILEVKNIKKSFNTFIAVDGISFSVKEGEIVGILGPNGAGKTTTLQMLLGILTPTAGTISYFGKNLETHKEEIHEQLNFSSTYTNLPWNLTVLENLTFVSYLYTIENRKKRIAKIIDIFRLEELKYKTISQLSAGQSTRVNLAKAMINYPKVLLLDEPTASLDPEVAAYLREFLQTQRTQFQMTIMITSHNMAEVEEMCDRVIFIDHGKIIADDTPGNLAKTIEVCHIQFLMNTHIEKAISFAKKEHIRYIVEKKRITFDVKENEIAHLLQKLSSNHISYDEISIVKPNLEDYFLQKARKEVSMHEVA